MRDLLRLLRPLLRPRYCAWSPYPVKSYGCYCWNGESSELLKVSRLQHHQGCHRFRSVGAQTSEDNHPILLLGSSGSGHEEGLRGSTRRILPRGCKPFLLHIQLLYRANQKSCGESLPISKPAIGNGHISLRTVLKNVNSILTCISSPQSLG